MAGISLLVYADRARACVNSMQLSASFSRRFAFAAMLTAISFNLKCGMVDVEAAF